TSYDPGGAIDAMSLYNSEIVSDLYLSYRGMFSLDGLLQYNSTGMSPLLADFGLFLSDFGLATPAANASPSASFFGMTQGDYDALALQFVLKKPDNISGDSRVIDQYNQYYGQYVALFRAYETELIAVNKNGVNAGVFGVSPISGGVVLSYSDYAAVLGALDGALQLDPAAIRIPVPVTTADVYYNLKAKTGAITFDPNTGFATATTQDYVTQWTAYFYNVINANLENSEFTTLSNTVGQPTLAKATAADFKAGDVAAIPVTPPAPPPAYTTLQESTYAPSVNNPVHPADKIANNPAVYSVPGVASVTVLNTTAAASVMSSVVSGKGSFSYDFVAGAVFGPNNALSLDPNAVVPTSSLSSSVTGNITIDGHTSYVDPLGRSVAGAQLTVYIPTLVRTGTGSITMSAAGNVAFLDTTMPGAVYTAGAAIDTPADFTAPSLPARYTSTPNGLVSTPAWTVGGGTVTVNAGGSIIGIETPVDADATQTGFKGAPTGELWSSWYYRTGQSNGSPTPFSSCVCQTAAWVNFATFFQGFGALGGGDITLTAGADIKDIGASLPETLVVGGGVTPNDPPHIRYYGGGDLRVTAGGNLLSSDFLVGRGTGQIQVGGSIVLDPSVTVPASVSNPQGSRIFLPLLLAVQDGFISLAAKGSITIGGIYDPTAVPSNAETLTFSSALPADDGHTFGSLFTSFGPDSGVSALSVSGDVTALTVPTAVSVFVHRPQGSTLSTVRAGLLLPATFELTALGGSIAVNTALPSPDGDGNPANLVPYPTRVGDDIGTLSLVAAGSISLGQGLSMPGLSTSSSQYVANDNGISRDNYISPLGLPEPNLTVALHANDPSPVIIVAGQDILAFNPINGSRATVNLVKPAEIEAGHNINAPGFRFSGQNNIPTDITSIVAGNDFTGGTYSLSGPGIFLLQAGHDLGPFTGSGAQVGTTIAGITTSGASSAPGGGVVQGAELDLLFGVKPGVNYAGIIAAYGDPSAPNGIDLASGIVTELQALANQLIQSRQLGLVVAGVGRLTTGDPAKAFQGMNTDQIDRALANLAATAGFIDPKTHNPLAFNATASDIQKLLQPQSVLQLYQQVFNLIVQTASAAGVTNTVKLSPADAATLYQAMSSLKLNQELDALAVQAGLTNLSFDLTTLDLPALQHLQQQMQFALDRNFLNLLTQVGKDYHDPSSQYFQQYARAYQAIATLFPASFGYTDNGDNGSNGAAARITTGHLNIAASVVETQSGGDINIVGPGGGITVGHTTRDALAPNQEGILTLAGGTIRVYTDGSILLNQSRIMTEQGGDVDLFTANGDINAGSGPKSYVSSPALSESCDVNGFCTVNPQGLVTGAGIAALTTLPGEDKSKSNANLFAPHGTIDAGSAGIRVAGTLNIYALQILNAYNVQTQGVAIGLPAVAGPPALALATANNTAGSMVKSEAPQAGNSDKPSVIIVEFLGFGGSEDDTGAPAQSKDDRERRSSNEPSYDPGSAFRLIGNGALTPDQERSLTEQERSRLRQLELSHAL
ncbi:MAG: filamentous hemagglutinin family protein, partial [Bradyrhizobium sp.]|uniref:filamentous haemagglutinin family protein n=1 Tax=Bradyrhizobium sp. TaxID=376 RepID=UPI001E0914D8